MPFYLFPFKACFNKLLYDFFVCIFRCYDRSRVSIRDDQCRRLSVQSVYFNFNTLSCQNYFFRGYGRGGGGVYIIVVEIKDKQWIRCTIPFIDQLQACTCMHLISAHCVINPLPQVTDPCVDSILSW